MHRTNSRFSQDLKEFLKLAMLVVTAFGSAFYVLVHSATRQQLHSQREQASGGDDLLEPRGQSQREVGSCCEVWGVL